MAEPDHHVGKYAAGKWPAPTAIKAADQRMPRSLINLGANDGDCPPPGAACKVVDDLSDFQAIFGGMPLL